MQRHCDLQILKIVLYIPRIGVFDDDTGITPNDIISNTTSARNITTPYPIFSPLFGGRRNISTPINDVRMSGTMTFMT